MKTLKLCLVLMVFSINAFASDDSSCDGYLNSEVSDVVFSEPTLWGFMDEVDDEWFPFFCGKDMGGYLDDQHNPELEKTLYKIFPDYELSAGDGESMHSIALKDGQSIEDIKKVISERLTKAGAKEMAN